MAESLGLGEDEELSEDTVLCIYPDQIVFWVRLKPGELIGRDGRIIEPDSEDD